MKKTLLLVVAAVLSCMTAMAQWNSNNAENLLVWPNESFYSNDMALTPDGSVWLAVNHPNGGRVVTSLQLIDAEGNFKFEKPLMISDYPSRTWTSVSQIIFVDREGNAIVPIYDQRMSDKGFESYTVYKISQEGEVLIFLTEES